MKEVRKDVILEALIDEIMNNSETEPELKTNIIGGYKKPQKIRKSGSENSFIPDLVVERDNRSDCYSIEFDENLDKQKLQILYAFARQNNGDLFVVLPEDKKKEIKDKLVDCQVSANIIKF